MIRKTIGSLSSKVIKSPELASSAVGGALGAASTYYATGSAREALKGGLAGAGIGLVGSKILKGEKPNQDSLSDQARSLYQKNRSKYENPPK